MGNPTGPHFLMVVISGTERKCAVRVQSITGIYETDRRNKRVTVIEYAATDVVTDTPISDVLSAVTSDDNLFVVSSPAA